MTECSAGARFLAAERGAFEREEDSPVVEPPVKRGRLVERLSAKSLAELASFCCTGVAEFVARFQEGQCLKP
jgi:hypothetical protein